MESGQSVSPSSLGVSDNVLMDGTPAAHLPPGCLLCGGAFEGDTESHLYSHCSHIDIVGIRQAAVTSLQQLGDGIKEGLPQRIIEGVRSLLLSLPLRHRVWKGVVSVDQLRGILQANEDDAVESLDRDTLIGIAKIIKGGFRIGGDAVLAMRQMSWSLGGVLPLVVKSPRSSQDKRRDLRWERDGRVSIVSSLGIMSPTEAVKWELERRKRRRDKARAHRERNIKLPKVFVGDFPGEVHQEQRLRTKPGRKDSQFRKVWDVH